ncbi:unnamed protein product [Prunus armeniaca]
MGWGHALRGVKGRRSEGILSSTWMAYILSFFLGQLRGQGRGVGASYEIMCCVFIGRMSSASAEHQQKILWPKK